MLHHLQVPPGILRARKVGTQSHETVKAPHAVDVTEVVSTIYAQPGVHRQQFLGKHDRSHATSPHLQDLYHPRPDPLVDRRHWEESWRDDEGHDPAIQSEGNLSLRLGNGDQDQRSGMRQGVGRLEWKSRQALHVELLVQQPFLMRRLKLLS
jgi:hypothetical protein